MEQKKGPEKNYTPQKKSMQTILFETVHGKITHTCSPFRVLPNFSTPPSRIARINNPFEQHLIERLHLPVFSPTVFKMSSPNVADEKFKWTIEDIAKLKPADIDVTTVDQHVVQENDSAIEMTAQEKIDTFFSVQEIVPSPFNQVSKPVPLIVNDNSPKEQKKSDVVDGSTQTMLTLPPNLPQHVENVLLPYFNYMENHQQDLMKTPESDLHRKLFDFEENDQSKTESVQTSPPLSIGLLSPIQMSPFENKMHNSRISDGIDNVPLLRDCNLSPIGGESGLGRSSRKWRPAGELNFSGHMSVDVDSFVVPDTNDQLPLNHSDKYEYPLIVNDVLSDSANNWDMEYKHITLASPTNSKNTSANEMDVSNSNTPRSKIFCSQRKKLSDSFMKIENKENVYEENVTNTRDNLLLYSEDVTDVGYQTGSLMTSEEWTNNYLFASTPTKRKY